MIFKYGDKVLYYPQDADHCSGMTKCMGRITYKDPDSYYSEVDVCWSESCEKHERSKVQSFVYPETCLVNLSEICSV